MNRSIQKAAYLLYVCSVILPVVSGCKKADKPVAIVAPGSLHVPMISQRGYEWCWAACTEMVSAYYHYKIDPNAPVIRQCDLANLVFFGDLKCPVMVGEVPDSLDQPTVPFPNLGDTNCEGYIFSQTFGSVHPNVANSIAELPFDSLKWIIAHKSPVIFEWGWEGITIATIDSGSTHYMVAEGIPHSSYINDPGWVSVNDPWPIGMGKHRIMAYSEYANHIPTSSPGSNTIVFNAHGVDYFGFQHSGK